MSAYVLPEDRPAWSDLIALPVELDSDPSDVPPWEDPDITHLAVCSTA